MLQELPTGGQREEQGPGALRARAAVGRCGRVRHQKAAGA